MLGIFIFIILPLLVYYFVVMLYWKFSLKRIENTIKRRAILILLLLFPCDHIVGMIVQKYMCDGIKIYKTVTDEKEQRAFWLTDFKRMVPPQGNVGSAIGIEAHYYPTKDLQEFKPAYINDCANEQKKYNADTYCESADEIIKRNNLEVYKALPYNQQILEAIDMKKGYSKLEPTRVLANDILEPAYLNYCEEKYDHLLDNNPNYKFSCKYNDELIKKYDLQNVIKVSKSRYEKYWSTFDKNFKEDIPFLGVRRKYEKIWDKETGEILAEYKGAIHYGGWFMRYIFPFRYISYCKSKGLSTDTMAKVIPNPYIKKQ